MLIKDSHIDHYRILYFLGSGTVGGVYLAEDTRFNRPVAIKVFQTQTTPTVPDSGPNGGREDTHLFQREMQAISMLSHPHILPLLDFGEVNVDGIILTYLVMPFCHQGSFADWLRERKSSKLLSPHIIARLVQQVAGALQYAHDQQVIHQNVKPSNLLIQGSKEDLSYPNLLLTDFSITKFNAAVSDPQQTLQRSSIFSAPEQLRGQPVPATDQYALALITYQLLTGRPPFQDASEYMRYINANVLPTPLSTLNPLLPKVIDTLILRALAKRPEDRFVSITEFAQTFKQGWHNLPGSKDLRATLTISSTEAVNGVTRTLTLPGGRQVIAVVPAEAYDGQIIRLAGLGDPPPNDDSEGALILTIAVTPLEKTQPGFVPHTTTLAAQPGGQLSKGKTILLIGLVLLLLASNIGVLVYFVRASSLNVLNTNALVKNAIRATTNVQARETSQISTAVMAAITATQNPYWPYSGKLALNDPLKDNSKGYHWYTSNDPPHICKFIGGAFLLSDLDLQSLTYCKASGNFSNFAFQVQMMIVKGNQGGIAFRDGGVNGNIYYLLINTDGSYHLSVNYNKILSSGFSSAIKTRLNQFNLLAVVAVVNKINIYVNLRLLASVNDNSSSQGQIGVVADNTGNPSDVVFSNAKVWIL